MAIAAAPAAVEGAEAAAGRAGARRAAAKKSGGTKAAPGGGGADKPPGRSKPGGDGGGRGGGQGSGRKAQSSTGSGRRSHRAVSWAFSGSRRLLTAQFVLCVVVLMLGALVAPAKDTPHTAVKALTKGSALALVFFLLALLQSGGKGSAKAATALGSLITVTYVLTSSDVHAVVSWVGSFFTGAAKREHAATPEQLQNEAENQPPFEGAGQ